MDSPPRNDEWMPLASQQLRLRHLIRIIGLNILCRERCRLYFTLHHKADCPAFYRSGDIDHYGNSEAILWDSITSPEILKSNSRAVCVRVWEQKPGQLKEEEKPIFTWRVWFSGLVLTGSGIDAKHFSNTLIFQLNENNFSSPDHFSSFSMKNNDYLYDGFQDHDPNAVKIHNAELRELPDGSGSRGGFTMKSDTASNSKSKTADSSLDLCGIRCISAQRLRNSTRQSYNLDKLLRIQRIQRSCKRLKEDLQVITEQIINQKLRKKNFVSKGRTIDYLFSDVDEVNPEAKVECKELKIKIEQLRFKCNLLEKEHKLAIVRTQELRNQLRFEKDSTKECSDALRENNSRLIEDKAVLYKKFKVILSDVKTKKDLEMMINRRLGLLGRELKYIYPIHRNSFGWFTVSNLPFPDKNYLSSSSLSTDHGKLMTPAALSVTLGFVTHFVEIIAIILNKTLRFPQHNKSPIPSKQILYGIYLLNYNIAQLNYDVFQTPYDSRREIIDNFLKLLYSLIKLGNISNDDVTDSTADGEMSILRAINRVEDMQKPRSSQQPNITFHVEHGMLRRKKNTLAASAEDKRYHSEDNLKTLTDHCLKHSYSHERLDKE